MPHFTRIAFASVMSLNIGLTMATIPEPAAAADAGSPLNLWPGKTPGAQKVTVTEAVIERSPVGPLRDRFVEHVTTPQLTRLPPTSAANGITLLIVPGGGYQRVVIDKEGFESAEWFRARGFECAVLRYRLPGDGWVAGADAPIHDAMRAIRLLRSGANASQRIGVIGFSAGGHLVARLITEPGLSYARADAADDLSARPDFAILMYPVIETTGPNAHAGSAQQLLAAGVPQESLARYSPANHVSATTPPTMLVHAADDDVVPVENSLVMYAALKKGGVRSELHVFDAGRHGFGLRGIDGKDVAIWPTLAEHWALSMAH